MRPTRATESADGGFEKDAENCAEDDYMLPGSSDRKLRLKENNWVVVTVLLVLCMTLPVLTYFYGLHKGREIVPQLPTHCMVFWPGILALLSLLTDRKAVTRNAVSYQLTLLDDEFDVELPENARFKGRPRPELDEAWEGLIAGMHVRVPHQHALAANFTSLELADGSLDRWGTPTVFHNLHCLKSIRQAQFPDIYPENWDVMKPQENGAMSRHFDHCLENLRQAIMCQGDVSLYRYTWRDDFILPKQSMKAPHICVDWDRLQGWAIEHSFSINDGLLVHPTLGPIDPSKWVELAKAYEAARHKDTPSMSEA